MTDVNWDAGPAEVVSATPVGDGNWSWPSRLRLKLRNLQGDVYFAEVSVLTWVSPEGKEYSPQ